MRKRRVKRLFIGLGIIIIVLVVMTNHFIKVRTIPDYREVSQVKVSISGGDNAFSELDIKEKSNIMLMTDIHKELNQYADEEIDTWKSDVQITYIMDDSSSLDFDVEGIRDIEGYFEPIMNSEEYKKNQLPIFTMDDSKINKIVVTDSYIDRDISVDVRDQDTIDQLIALARQSALDNVVGMEGMIIADLDFYHDDDIESQTYCLRENTELFDYIKNHKELAIIPVGLDEIDYILIEDREKDKMITIKDHERMMLILDKYYSGYSSMDSTYGIEVIMKDQESRHWYGSFYKENEVEDVEEWFESSK